MCLNTVFKPSSILKEDTLKKNYGWGGEFFQRKKRSIAACNRNAWTAEHKWQAVKSHAGKRATLLPQLPVHIYASPITFHFKFSLQCTFIILLVFLPPKKKGLLLSSEWWRCPRWATIQRTVPETRRRGQLQHPLSPACHGRTEHISTAWLRAADAVLLDCWMRTFLRQLAEAYHKHAAGCGFMWVNNATFWF